MRRRGNWQVRELEDAMPPEEFAKWAVAPMPQRTAGPPVTGAGGWVWVVFARDPERRAAAADFILDIETAANGARISEATGDSPDVAYRSTTSFARSMPTMVSRESR